MIMQSLTDDNQCYTVERDVHECDSKCALRCQECNACVHMYSCNCSDVLIHHTICKHIHLVASSNNHQPGEAQMDCIDLSEYEPLLDTLLHQNDTPDSVSAIKSSLIEKLSSLSKIVTVCQHCP